MKKPKFITLEEAYETQIVYYLRIWSTLFSIYTNILETNS